MSGFNSIYDVWLLSNQITVMFGGFFFFKRCFQIKIQCQIFKRCLIVKLRNKIEIIWSLIFFFNLKEMTTQILKKKKWKWSQLNKA